VVIPSVMLQSILFQNNPRRKRLLSGIMFKVICVLLSPVLFLLYELYFDNTWLKTQKKRDINRKIKEEYSIANSGKYFNLLESDYTNDLLFGVGLASVLEVIGFGIYMLYRDQS
jgi:hypothetical protein